jgi:hypothetical protein
MGEWALLLPALHEHRDRRPNTLIDEHHENLVLVAKKDRNRCLLRQRREPARQQRVYSKRTARESKK